MRIKFFFFFFQSRDILNWTVLKKFIFLFVLLISSGGRRVGGAELISEGTGAFVYPQPAGKLGRLPSWRPIKWDLSAVVRGGDGGEEKLKKSSVLLLPLSFGKRIGKETSISHQTINGSLLNVIVRTTSPRHKNALSFFIDNNKKSTNHKLNAINKPILLVRSQQLLLSRSTHTKMGKNGAKEALVEISRQSNGTEFPPFSFLFFLTSVRPSVHFF